MNVKALLSLESFVVIIFADLRDLRLDLDAEPEGSRARNIAIAEMLLCQKNQNLLISIVEGFQNLLCLNYSSDS